MIPMLDAVFWSLQARQRGMSLFPAMMFLLVLAILGVAALNSTLLQEKMAGNTRDSNMAFQAAEAALRDAEADVAQNVTPGTVCDRSVHAAVDMADAHVGGHLQAHRLDQCRDEANLWQPHGCGLAARRCGAASIRHRETVESGRGAG